MSRILNDKDRNALLEKYKEDKLKDAPANITDKTLIENYGTDEQKALLATPAPQTTKGVENTETTANAAAAAKAPATATVSDEQKAPTSQEYVDALNDYIVLNDGQAPKGQLSLEELKAANEAKTQELQRQPAQAPAQAPKKADKKTAPAQTPNLQTSTLNKNVEKVVLTNKAGQERKISRFTYDNYLKNDAVWKLKPSAPSEVKNL